MRVRQQGLLGGSRAAGLIEGTANNVIISYRQLLTLSCSWEIIFLGGLIENSMRDGIYKNLPLSKPWRALLRSCTLDAARGEVAREKCERAAGLELREIRPQFMAAFREKAEDAGSFLPGFNAFGPEVATGGLGGQKLPYRESDARAGQTS